MPFDQNFAWLERDRLTLLLPDGGSRQFTFDRNTKAIEPAATTHPEAVRQALANVLMLAWQYSERRYRVSKLGAFRIGNPLCAGASAAPTRQLRRRRSSRVDQNP